MVRHFIIVGFNKGLYTKGDRLIQDDVVMNLFQRTIKSFLGEDSLSSEFCYYLTDLMKTNSGMISYSILKKKISSNLKNFKEIKFMQSSDRFANSMTSKFR